MIRRLISLVCLLCLFASGAGAEESYVYNYRNETVPSLAAYSVSRVISGRDLGLETLAGASDLFLRDDLAYVADTARSRILVLNLQENRVVHIIDGFDKDGTRETFNKPQGVFVTAAGDVYVADTQNYRIVHLNPDYSLHTLINRPVADVITDRYVFKPQKVAVDTGGRVYVVAEGTTEGLVQFTETGEFISFFGGNEVKPDFAELILRMFLNKEQRQKRSTFIPVEYSNLVIDDKNFIYTTTVNTADNQMRRLNFQGGNIMRYEGRNRNQMGDLGAADNPFMIDVTVDSQGNFAGLDSRRGRVYCYNALGKLLAIFGGYGTARGQFRSPTALDEQEGSYYVLDAVKASITVFSPTAFGTLVREGNDAFFRGEYDTSRQDWEKALALNSNYDLAYQSLGDIAYKEEDWSQAMACYRRAHDKQGYSRAFREARTAWMRANFTYVMTGALALIGVILATRKPRRSLKRKIHTYFDLD